MSSGYRYVNGYIYQASPGATTTIGYAWFDGAVQAQVSYAVAVTVLTRVPLAKLFAGLGVGSAAPAGAALLSGTTIGAASAAGIAGGVAAGAVASAASQAFGVAAGIQDKFSWKGVALAGISAGVSGGLAGSFDKIAGSPFLGDAVRGALGSAIGQGIGVATGLQSKFDFAGVAAAGLGMGASGAIGLGGFGGRLLSNTAGGLANAAARSLIEGTSFGDNILAALPDVIGQTIGDAVAGKVAARNIERRESLSGIRASTATEGVSDLAGGDLFSLILETARQMLGLSDEATIVVTGQRESWRDIAYGPVEDRFADLLQQQRITSTLSLRDQVRRFDGYRRLDGYQGAPARPPGTSISSAPRGALGYGGNVTGSVGHYVQGLTASTLKSIVSSGGNTGQMFRDAIGNGSHAATAIVSETLRSLYPDNGDMFSAQARAANNARHPFLLDPNHVSSNAEKRGIIAAAVVSLVGARGMGARASAAESVPITGETLATATGKSIHADLAAARRASGDFDLVNAPLVDANGVAIQVPKRVNLTTGEPLDARVQIARPDAVRFKNDLILDDKPLGRPIAKDRQEIIRFIDAYTQSQGSLPSRIAIQRYSPVTGRPVVTELYGPEDFLPKGR